MSLPSVVLFAATFASAVWAQFPTAQCGPGFDWNKNSLGQDPCTVGSKLGAFCRGLAQYSFPPLNASEWYLPPDTSVSGDVMCDCNTVAYSLSMACISCQNGTVYSWPQWIPQCTTISITVYPADVAQGTAVPHWAYVNVTSLPGTIYSDSVAMSVGRDPEEFPSTNTNTTGSSTDPKKNVGAIVGGVFGSLILLAILAVAAFLYRRYCRRQQAGDPYKQSPMAHEPSTISAPLLLYDPSDPSTFPQSPSDPVRYSAHGAYSGVPEI
ncbi:hypothetical protein BJ322DRAFT_400690 [Thelephora terrestris]|uniref:Transmembrane protein n=1 Tax=Thelephora terrestris TaxID=56493 RepID=A0A9P6LAY8_9AGAM|nr:hypothetical protein BJ322DRAFT_400690 [Thelephora terrestris]